MKTQIPQEDSNWGIRGQNLTAAHRASLFTPSERNDNFPAHVGVMPAAVYELPFTPRGQLRPGSLTHLRFHPIYGGGRLDTRANR